MVGLLIAHVGLARAQPGAPGAPGAPVVLALYAPTLPFARGQDRLAYVQGLAARLAGELGMAVEGRSYASLMALRRDQPEIAIVEPQCAMQLVGGHVIAAAMVQGATSRPWNIYAREAKRLSQLKGKKLVFTQTSCGDEALVSNAVLGGDIPATFWGSMVGKNDVNAAWADVFSYKSGDAVVAPGGLGNGTALYEAVALPNPVVVVSPRRLTAALQVTLSKTLVELAADGPVEGWQRSTDDLVATLRGRMSVRRKVPMLAPPEPVRLAPTELRRPPATYATGIRIPVLQHWQSGD